MIVSFKAHPCEDREGAGQATACVRYRQLAPVRPLWCQLCQGNPKYRAAFERGWHPERPAQPISYDQRVERTVADLATEAEARILRCRERWQDKTLTRAQCAALCQARGAAEIQRTLRHCVGRCVYFETDRCGRYDPSCEGRTRWMERILRYPCPMERMHQAMACRHGGTRLITLSDLRADTLVLASQLPPTITRIVGIARSGMMPASMLACLWHVPLWSTSPKGLVDLGTTYRLKPANAPRDHVLLVDDTAHRGKAMERYGAVVRSRWRDAELTRAVVYTTPFARKWVDVAAVELPPPHYLEWHLFNSPYAHAAMDFDGVLCHDIAPEDDDDGPRYRAALANAKPKYLVRSCRVPLIVTARLDRPEYREITQRWLSGHGIQVDRLVMGPWKSLAQRNQPGRVARWKAKTYQDSDLKLFIESDPDQARQIARDSGKPVLCPAAKLVYRM